MPSTLGPVSVAIGREVVTFHRSTLSPPPVASVFPSGLNATESPLPLVPW